MKHNVIRLLTLLLALSMLTSLIPAAAAEETERSIDMALGIDDTTYSDKILITLDDSEDANAILKETPLYISVVCPFDKAFVLDENETPVASYFVEDGSGMLAFEVSHGGTYTVQDAGSFGIQVYGANMVLGNELAMNFFLERASVETYITQMGGSVTAEDLSIQVIKTFADGRDDVVKDYAFSDWTVSGSYYKITFDDISAKEMADTIFVRVYNGDGSPASDLWTDSVRDYVKRTLAADESAQVKTLMVDMLNYGAAAQQQFGYGLSDLANSTLTAEQQALATGDVTMADNRVKGTNYYGTNLNLASNISLGLFFRNVSRDMTAQISYTTVLGEERSYEVSGSDFIHYTGNIYRVMVNTLSVKDARQVVTCTIKDAQGNVIATAQDSVEGWVARNTANTQINSAIMKFVTSAKAYFESKN